MAAAGTRELALMISGSEREAEQTPESQEFARLLRRAKAGDASAFRQIIDQHQRQVLMTALRLLGRLELAQDAA
jgi:hypothetical protein